VDQVVLVVCHANMCRSPLAQLRLGEQLRFLGWRVVSRGTHARTGSGLCRSVAESITADAGGREFAPAFRAQRLAPADLDAALILTASSEEKSAVARLRPSCRDRSFTLPEAAALADVVGSRSLAGLDPASTALCLNGARREARLPEPRDRSLWDIPDAHLSGVDKHAATLAAVATCVDRIVRALQG
jgi:protein-tyrosine phosphatase